MKQNGVVRTIPRIDADDLNVYRCPVCKKERYYDIHEVYGLPPQGWRMCAYCGYTSDRRRK